MCSWFMLYHTKLKEMQHRDPLEELAAALGKGLPDSAAPVRLLGYNETNSGGIVSPHWHTLCFLKSCNAKSLPHVLVHLCSSRTEWPHRGNHSHTKEAHGGMRWSQLCGKGLEILGTGLFPHRCEELPEGQQGRKPQPSRLDGAIPGGASRASRAWVLLKGRGGKERSLPVLPPPQQKGFWRLWSHLMSFWIRLLQNSWSVWALFQMEADDKPMVHSSRASPTPAADLAFGCRSGQLISAAWMDVWHRQSIFLSSQRQGKSPHAPFESWLYEFDVKWIFSSMWCRPVSFS